MALRMFMMKWNIQVSLEIEFSRTCEMGKVSLEYKHIVDLQKTT